MYFWGEISKLGKKWEKNVVPRRPDLFPLFSFVSLITRWFVKEIGVSHAKPPPQTRADKAEEFPPITLQTQIKL